ncbi:fascin-like isoform X1 [Petromyzon marinus]|uniref:fascin-like isoform X1 n=1 Tax=Petromyzon marinus TaxID=7757 RepID=UPI003F72040C
MSDGPPRGLQLGLVSSAGGYLTAETFGFKVTASGSSLKKKQTWTLETLPGTTTGTTTTTTGTGVTGTGESPDGGAVSLRSHLGRLLGADRDGAVSGQAEAPGTATAWGLQARPDGRWALRHAQHGRYLGGSADRVRCFAQTVGNTELWSVHLATHPQLNLYNPGRKRYAQLSGDSVSVSCDVPWGVGSLLSLAFGEDGRYELRASDGRSLRADGALGPPRGDTASFTLEVHAGSVAFKDTEGRYLCPSGPSGILKSVRAASASALSRPAKDELFVLEESRAQITLRSTSSGRAVSARQGLDISANQEDEGETETFQMEAVPDGWSLRCFGGSYWAVSGASGGLQASASSQSSAAVFEVLWRGRSVALQVRGGKFVTAKKNGQLQATADTAGEAEEFSLRVVNRPLLVLRGPHGFVAVRRGSGVLDANRATYESFTLSAGPLSGTYHLHGEDGRAWVLCTDGSVSVSDVADPTAFCLELHPRNHVAIRVESSGCYVRGDHASSLRADSQSVDSDSLWEF